jgi:DNA-binding CsgD family transcriptional regulator
MTARINEAQLERIRELSGLGTTEIVRRTGLSPSAVHKYKKAMGLQGLRVLPETEILKLLKKGLAPRAIAQRLRISYRRTRTFAHAHGYGKPPRKKLTAAQEQALMADITNRRASAFALAKKHHASYKQVLEMAHRLLACERFLCSWRTPLSSYLPAKYVDAQMGQSVKGKNMDHANQIQENCLHIIDAAVRTLDGKIPPKEILVAVLASRFAPEKPDAEFFLLPLAVYRRARANFIANLAAAFDIFARDRDVTFLN